MSWKQLLKLVHVGGLALAWTVFSTGCQQSRAKSALLTALADGEHTVRPPVGQAIETARLSGGSGGQVTHQNGQQVRVKMTPGARCELVFR